MTETEVRDQAALKIRVEGWRRQRLRDRLELIRLERATWLVCALVGCGEPTAWVVALKGVQRAVCASHGAQAVEHGRAIVAVEAFLPAGES